MNKTTNRENKCALCSFCSYEESECGYVCHNEESEKYGFRLEMTFIEGQACPNFTPHNYDMTLEDALKAETYPDDFAGIFYNQKLPWNGNEYAYMTFVFKNNAALAKWKDAHSRLFAEYMTILKETQEPQEKTIPQPREYSCPDTTNTSAWTCAQCADEGISSPDEWYAVLKGDKDKDWQKGSYDFQEALTMLLQYHNWGYKNARISVISMGETPICVKTMDIEEAQNTVIDYPVIYED